MRTPLAFCALLLVFLVPARAGDGVIDLTKLANYAAQPIPNYIRKNNTTAGNNITDLGATLGRVLFHDKRLSRNSTVSCSSCHQQAHAFGDTATASSGVAGTTGRHSMRLVNSRFATEVRFFWDERAATLEAQTTRPIQDHTEMGFSGTSGDPAFADLVTRLTAIQEYRALFAAVFGDATITEARVQLALAQFVRSIQSFDSRYDVGRAQVQGDNNAFPNFTTSENNGKTLFINGPGNGGAGCNGCHRAPEFDIDPSSLNNGIITGFNGTDLTNTRSPSLKDLLGPGGSSNGAFMHDGSKTTLAAVIAHYNVIPGNNTNLDPRLRRAGNAVQNLNLTAQQRADIEAFLNTLTGSNVYTDPKWSDPFDANGQLSLLIVPAASTSLVNNGNGTATISSPGAKGLTYTLQSTTDFVTWTAVTSLTPSATTGLLTAQVNITPSTFYRFAYPIPVAPAAAAPAPAAAALTSVTSLVSTATTSATTTTTAPAATALTTRSTAQSTSIAAATTITTATHIAAAKMLAVGTKRKPRTTVLAGGR